MKGTKIKKSKAEVAFGVLNVCILTLLALVTLYPILHVLFGSFSEAELLMKHQGLMLKPVGFSLDGYKAVFAKEEIWIGYGNTLYYVLAGTAVNMIVTVPLAYMLSKPKLLFQKYIMMAIVFTMYFSGGLVPLYLTVQNLGITDTRWAVILPTAVSTYNLIILRTAFASMPESLEEAAKIDGAGVLTILWKIILPLTKASVAVIVLYYAVANWNQWFQAMLYIRKQELYPLQLFLRDILIENQNDDMTMGVSSGNQQSMYEVVRYATIVVSTLPILLFYPFIQKYFVQGVMIGAVKG